MDLSGIANSQTVAFVAGYLTQLPSLVMKGDIAAVIIGLILFYIALFLSYWTSYYLLKVIKKIIVLVIAGMAFYALGTEFLTRMAGGSPVIIFVGLVGISIAFLATLIAAFGLFAQGSKTLRQLRGVPSPQYAVARPQPKSLEDERRYYLGPAAQKQALAEPKKSGKQPFSLGGLLGGEGSLTMVLAYIAIAEFGVFSNAALTAPSVQAGMILAIVLLVIGAVFMARTSKSWRSGLAFLGVVIAIAVTVSVVLGTFWAQIPIEQLLSMDYFKSEALIATITGVALSVFMDKKGAIAPF